MSGPHKYLFDECVNLPILAALRQHFSSDANPPTLGHIIEMELDGQRDEDWIPGIASAGWVIISADKGKGGLKKGQKLKLVCVTYKVTHILLSQKIHNTKTPDKLQIIKDAWGAISKAPDADPGTRFSLQYDNKGNLVLRKMPIRQSP